MANSLTVGELSARSGVATSALRYYEERGLIAAQRTPAGHRRYPRAIIRRVAFIVFAQRVGMSLEEIGAELGRLPDDRVPERADWNRLSRAWRERIDERIAELQRLRESLGECIGCGCLSLDRCALANPGDRAGRQGAGPRYWIGDPRPATSGAGGVGSEAESVAPRSGARESGSKSGADAQR
jgi:MerR family transcriptional regulator, redox-sensitive transcriptional activator SoxR